MSINIVYNADWEASVSIAYLSIPLLTVVMLKIIQKLNYGMHEHDLLSF
jgi:hypothetical protein